METFIFFALGIGYICLFIWVLFLSRTHGLFSLTNVLLLVIIGLIYDNFIIALGRYIGEGNTLESLSYVRFWLHALFTPTLILFAWSICFKSDLSWAKKAYWKVLASLITVGLILYELITSVRGLELEPNWENGVLTYDSAGQAAGPFMVIAITLVLGIVSVIFIVKFHYYWLFIGILLMVLGSILGIWLKYSPLMNILEFVLILSLVLTKRFVGGLGLR
ncbi:hypothetical protein [Virgibacillus kimchii]